MAEITASKLQELLTKLRQQKEAEVLAKSQAVTQQTEVTNAIPSNTNLDGITYNKEQQSFIDLATTGKSCVLVGAAGTGKTTCTKGAVLSLIQSGLAGTYNDESHKTLTAGTPGIVLVSFTRRAVSNIRRQMPLDLYNNCLTIHKLLEYEPVYSTVYDEVLGKDRTKVEFLPARTEMRPLSETIHTVIIDESSMVSGSPFDSDFFLLFNRLKAALPHNPQYIFLGDIQQLPPVFGSAILGYKMLELPTIELTQVYRQALESPIIRLAHRILSGNAIPVEEYPEWKVEGKLTLHNWKKKIKADDALATIGLFFTKAVDSKLFNPEEDIILIPFNKACGTDELNKMIANHIARTNGKMTYEIVAGFNKYYFSEGDKVLIDKEDAIISRIVPNETYAGKPYQEPSTYLDYWGHNSEGYSKHSVMTDEQIDNILFNMNSDDEERVKVASHTIYYRRYNADKTLNSYEFEISTASEINSMILAYALTVHKSQGSEWRKVFCVFHQSHATMVSRELLYTAVTRAKEELYVICEPETFTNGIRSQRIRGNTLAEKAEYFKGKLEEGKGQ